MKEGVKKKLGKQKNRNGIANPRDEKGEKEKEKKGKQQRKQKGKRERRVKE